MPHAQKNTPKHPAAQSITDNTFFAKDPPQNTTAALNSTKTSAPKNKKAMINLPTKFNPRGINFLPDELG